MLWKAFRPAKVAFSYSNLQCRLFPCFLFYPITEHAILSFGPLCWGHVKTRSRFRGSPRKPETARVITCTFLFHNVTAGSVVGMPNQQCAVARRPRPGVNRTRSRLQERPKGAGTRPGGRRHGSHRCFLDPPPNPQMGRMRILSAGRRDLGRPAWDFDESVVNSSKVGGSRRTNGPGTPPPV